MIAPSAAAVGRFAAGRIADVVRRRPDAVLGLATGSTPLTTWAALAERGLDLGRVSGFALDEYVGLEPGHPESYRAVITREVVEPLGLTPSLVHVPADSGPIETAGEDYERAIDAAGGIDLQVLGIGRTGHVGFNEPGSSFASRTRVKTLTE
jgi:glucosamine-6-phosphate deaminase